MSNFLDVRPQDQEGRNFFPVALRGGLDQESSKFSVVPGTLDDSLNYNSSTRGYQRAEGLFFYDGTIDGAVGNMYVVAVNDSESTLNISGDGFILGNTATWGTGGSGRVVYYSRVSAAPDYTIIGLTEMLGGAPVAGNTITDSISGSTLVLNDPLTHNPSELATAVNPNTGAALAGTVTDYLALINNSVNSALVGQTSVVSGTYNTYHGTVPGVGGITGGWQYNDSVYVVRDAYSVDFDTGQVQFRPGEEVQVPYSSGSYETVTVASVELTASDWSLGTAQGRVVFVPSTNTADIRNLDNMDVPLGDIKDSTGSTTIARTNSNANHYAGAVWKGTVRGWEWVDTGWTVEYNTGTNAPNVKAAPLFLNSLIIATRSTSATAADTGASSGNAPDIAWTAPTAITANDATYATANLATTESTRYMNATIPAGILPQEDVRIVGVEVTVNARYTSGGTPALVDTDVRLINENTGGDLDFYVSPNKARREPLTGTDADYVYGGSTDKWGLDEISAVDLNSGNMGVLLQYTNTAATTGQVELDYISFVISYVPNNEKVWFYDGSADVSTGLIHALQIDSGTFAATTAAGNMSLSALSAPTAIGVGMQMRSEPSGGGLLIANVASTPKYNLLPSESQLLAADSQYQTIVANYYENDESEAVYGVTGAGPAFTYDGANFAIIRAPFDRSLDKPRHIAFHDNRLALGYPSGHVILSAVGVPNDFSAVDSSSSWGVGDTVTGLVSLSGSVLGVFSESSVRTLEGSDAANGTMRTVSPSTGAREYTLQNIVGPYFADNRGVNALNTTDKYGDFDMGRISDPVRTWIQARMQDRRTTEALDNTTVAAVAFRSKNQYRLYFADGYILVFYFRVDGSVEPTLMHYDTANYGTSYVPTFINSFILSNGRERVVMGNAAGDVYIVDGAECIQHPDGIVTPKCWITLNPINFNKPERVHKNYHVAIQGRFFGAQSVDTWGDDNYTFDDTGPAHESITFGAYSNSPLFSARSEADSTYLPILTDGFSVKLQTTMDGSLPHTFQSLLFRSSKKGVDRNSASKTY